MEKSGNSLRHILYPKMYLATLWQLPKDKNKKKLIFQLKRKLHNSFQQE